MMSKEISLQIVLQNAMEGTSYALQKGKGPNYETVQAQLGSGQDVVFDFTITVKEAGGPIPTLAGAFVQGPAGNRFVYIGMGSYAGQPGALWSGRMKIPLPEASFQNALPDESNSFFSCTVTGRTENGKPVLATVKPFRGWSMGKLSDLTGA